MGCGLGGWLAAQYQSWWMNLCQMDEGANVFFSLLPCAVCLSSAVPTFQIHHGAGAGLLLLQALASLVEATAPFAARLGLDWDSACLDGAWVSTVVGLPLLAFAFHWLNGDRSTANILWGGALLLAAGSDYFKEGCKQGPGGPFCLDGGLHHHSDRFGLYWECLWDRGQPSGGHGWPAGRFQAAAAAYAQEEGCPLLSHGCSQPDFAVGSANPASRIGLGGLRGCWLRPPTEAGAERDLFYI